MIKMLQYKMYPAGELAVLRQLLFYPESVFKNLMHVIDRNTKIRIEIAKIISRIHKRLVIINVS